MIRVSSMETQNPYATPTTANPVVDSRWNNKVGLSQAKSIRVLGNALIALLLLSSVMHILMIVVNVFQLNLLSRVFTQAEAETNDALVGSVGILSLILFLVTGVVFLTWIFRACKNCGSFGARGMQVTPGWSIGSYFIPILSLFRPYQSMREIDQVSRNPMSWSNQKVNPFLGWWWGFWIVSNLLGQISMRLGQDTLDELATVSRFTIVAAAAGIILCFFAIKVVKAITDNQEKLIRRMK